MLIAFNLPPAATFYNQALALAGWGAWCARLAFALMGRPPFDKAAAPLRVLLAAFATLALAALSVPLWTHLTVSLALGSVSVVAAAAFALTVGWRVGHSDRADEVFSTFCTALACAGALSLAIGLVQVFAPNWTDGRWIAVSSIPGRAVGNLRQPNHLSTLLLLACAAVVWLGSSGVRHAVESPPQREMRARWGVGALALLIWGVVLSGSRTGGLGVLMLAAWGALDRRLPRTLRAGLVAAPLIYLVWWGVMELWAHESAHAFGRSDGGSDISSSRFGIWANTLSLIGRHPWTGVGFGEFNLTWTLTPFPGRPTAFFDHTHNIVLQFLVELGIPLGALVLGLIGWGVWGLVQRARAEDSRHSGVQRAALFMVLLAGVHSLLEYPLWYAYFLLPVMFAWGLALAPAPAPSATPGARPSGGGSRRAAYGLALAGAVLALGSLYAVWDYQKVVAIYAPADGAGSLDERIERGQRSLFFSHQADYAAATTADHPGEAIDAFKRAAHNLIDGRLLRDWAEAEAALGHLDRARYLAHRLREFKRKEGDELFAVCDGSAASVAKHFQCGPDPKDLSFEDFR